MTRLNFRHISHFISNHFLIFKFLKNRANKLRIDYENGNGDLGDWYYLEISKSVDNSIVEDLYYLRIISYESFVRHSFTD